MSGRYSIGNRERIWQELEREPACGHRHGVPAWVAVLADRFAELEPGTPESDAVLERLIDWLDAP